MDAASISSSGMTLVNADDKTATSNIDNPSDPVPSPIRGTDKLSSAEGRETEALKSGDNTEGEALEKKEIQLEDNVKTQITKEEGSEEEGSEVKGQQLDTAPKDTEDPVNAVADQVEALSTGTEPELAEVEADQKESGALDPTDEQGGAKPYVDDGSERPSSRESNEEEG